MINGVGFGHVYRTLPIIKALAKRHKITTSTFGKAAEVLEENGYPDSYKLHPFGDVVAQGVKVNIKQSLFENVKQLSPGLITRASEIISDCRPDVVVVDGYLFGLFAAKMLGKKTVNIANCTKVWYVFPKISSIVEKGSDVLSRGIIESSDAVIVPDFAPPFIFSHNNIEYFGAERKFHFVGPTFTIKEKKKGRRPIIGMGGSGHRESLEPIAEILEKMGYSPIIADGNLGDEEIREATAHAPFAITHGGHTTIMSSISANTPVIPIPLKGYTERMNNALGVQNNGCGVVINPELADTDTVQIAIQKIKTQYIRENTALFASTAHSIKGHIKAGEIIENVGKRKGGFFNILKTKKIN